MKDFWNGVDIETIRKLDEHWHWNVTHLMKGDSVKDVHYYECPMYIRLIIAFNMGMVRIDEYSKHTGSNPADTKHTIVLGPEDIRTIKGLLKREKKQETWNQLLHRFGARGDVT